MLKVDNLHKSFGDKEILKGISFEVKSGKIFGFIGHNGAGKTTTIRCAVGILDFEKGSIEIDGKDLKKDPIGCKQVMAYIPDNPDLYDNLTGVQYLNFIADMFEVDAAERTKRIESLAKELEIYDSLGDPISALSHGMKQKVALISAFMHQPKLLVLDEPFVGLDPKASYTLKMKMKELCDSGSSIFFSSHVLEVVQKLCDHIAILRAGEIIRIGKTDEIVHPDQSLEDLFLELSEMKKNTWLLIKVQLKNLFFHKRKKGSRGGIAGMLIAAGAILYVDAVYNWMLYSSVDPAHYYAVPELLVTVGIVCVFMFGVNSAQGELFGFKDFDMLMALPVSAESIFISKISTFMILEYLYSALFVIPTMCIYGVMAHASFVFYLFAFIGFIFLPMLPAVLASLIALGIRKLTSKMKNKNFFNNLFQIILVGAIFAFSFGMNGMDDASAANLFINAADSITRYFPFADWYVMGSIQGNFIDLLLFCILNLAAFAALIIVFSKSFLKINLAGKQGYHVRNFRLHRKNANSPFMALFKKELKKYFGNFMYVMNMSIGQVMLLIGAVYLLFNQKAVNGVLAIAFEGSGFIEYGALILALLCGLMAHLSCTTSCSISLEGKCMWITKTLPVGTSKIFASKILVNLVVILVPTLLAYGIISIVFNVPLLIAVLAIVYIIAAALFVSMGGLTVNLLFPKLEFDREIIVIKQSASTFISVIGGMLTGGLIIFLFVNFAGSAEEGRMIFSIITAGYAVADIILFIYLQKGGRNRFEKLA